MKQGMIWSFLGADSGIKTKYQLVPKIKKKQSLLQKSTMINHLCIHVTLIYHVEIV